MFTSSIAFSFQVRYSSNLHFSTWQQTPSPQVQGRPGQDQTGGVKQAPFGYPWATGRKFEKYVLKPPTQVCGDSLSDDVFFKKFVEKGELW